MDPVLRGGPGDTGDPAGAGGGPGVDAGETAGGDTGEPLGEGPGRRAALPGGSQLANWKMAPFSSLSHENSGFPSQTLTFPDGRCGEVG